MSNAISIISVIIAALAASVSFFSFKASKQAERATALSNELATLPALMPEKRVNKRGGTVGLLVKNRGPGPAVIDSMLITHVPDITVDAALNNNWMNELQTKLKDSANNKNKVYELPNVTPVKQVLTGSVSRGSVLNSGEELWFIKGDLDDLTEDELKTVIGWTENLQVRAIYSSVFLRSFDSQERYEKYLKDIHSKYTWCCGFRWILKQLLQRH